MHKKGIKGHWRPVYNNSVYATTTSGWTFVTVLDLTASKKGRATVLMGSHIYDWDQWMELRITVDGVVIFEGAQGRGGSYSWQGVFDFEDSFKVEHRAYGLWGRTDIAYYYFPN